MGFFFFSSSLRFLSNWIFKIIKINNNYNTTRQFSATNNFGNEKEKKISPMNIFPYHAEKNKCRKLLEPFLWMSYTTWHSAMFFPSKDVNYLVRNFYKGKCEPGSFKWNKKGSQGGETCIWREMLCLTKGITSPVNAPVVMSRTCDFPDVWERGNNNAWRILRTEAGRPRLQGDMYRLLILG